MSEIIRDVTEEFNMPVDTSAAIFRISDGFAVAWGRGYDAMANDRHWDSHGNTCDHGARLFPTLVEAEDCVDEVAECNEIENDE